MLTSYRKGDRVEYRTMECEVDEVLVDRMTDAWAVYYRIREIHVGHVFVVQEYEITPIQQQLF